MSVGVLVYASITTLVVGFLLQPLVLRFMKARSVLDIPSERSSHTVATPRGGGVAVIVAVLIGMALYPPARPLMMPILLCGVIGLAEDIRGIGVVARLAAQLVIGAGTGLALVPLDQGPVGQVLVVIGCAVWLAGYVNAFNFMDGINGISALFAILAGVVYTVVGLREDLPLLTGAATLVAIGAATFLPWNAGRAKIFLGDVGSYGLGAGLAGLAAYAALHGVALEVALAPLALYLVDTGSTLVRRLRAGEDVLSPHRTHVYQRLTDVGWSHARVALVCTGVAAVVSVCALVGSTLAPAARASLVGTALVILVAYLLAPGFIAVRRPVRRIARQPVLPGQPVRESAGVEDTVDVEAGRERDAGRRGGGAALRQAGEPPSAQAGSGRGEPVDGTESEGRTLHV